MDYKITEKAQEDMDSALHYIAVELANTTAARELFHKIENVITECCEQPKSGTRVYNQYLQSTEVRKKLVNNYVLYYYPNFEENTIYVLRFLYGKSNLEEIIRYIFG